MKTRCLNCFAEYDDRFGLCPICGEMEVEARETIDLTPGTVLAGRYLVGRSVGAGGFGIIYKAWDTQRQTVVAIKEYYPTRLVTRAYGQKNLSLTGKSRNEYEYRKSRFLAEARTMARFGSHRNLPRGYEYFEENDTAYIVMEFLDGISLSEYMMQEKGALDPDFALHVTKEIGNALSDLHAKGIIHRDVAPDNIFLCSDKDMSIKLLDLGAAKLAGDDSDVVDIVLKPGYSPIEQYDEKDTTRKNLDERTDIYSLAAVFYSMLTGLKPQEAVNRKVKDSLRSPSEINPDIPRNISNATMKALAVDKRARFSSVEEFICALDGKKAVMDPGQEKMLRLGIRIGCIAAVLAVLGTGIFFLVRFIKHKKAQPDLDACKIELWYVGESGSAKEEAMESIRKDFKKQYPDVQLKLISYSAEEYEAKIKAAAKDGELPNLFESSVLSDDFLSDCEDLSDILKSDEAEACSLLKYYGDCYPDGKQMPVGVSYPVACIINNGYTSTDYRSDYFMSAADFPLDSLVSYDPEAKGLVSKNNDLSQLAIGDSFFDQEGNRSSVLLTSTMNRQKVTEAISKYGCQFAYCDSNEAYGQFVYEWSVGGGSKEEIAAAKKVLTFMLGSKYQGYLMDSSERSGALPLCDDALSKLAKEEKDLEPLLEMEPYEKFIQYEPENAKELSENERLVYTCFETVLFRDPTEDEMNVWLVEIAKKQNGLMLLEKELLLSDEFSKRIYTDEQFAKTSARMVLRRDATEEEIEEALLMFSNGKSREDWLNILFAKEEWTSYSTAKGFSGPDA